MSIELTMPRLSDTMESGTLLKWNVSAGDEVSAGDSIADIETDKATMEMQVYDDGVVAKLLLDEGETVDVGTPIAVLAEDDENWQEVAEQSGEQTSAGQSKGEEKAAAAEGGAEEGEGGTATAVAEPPKEKQKEESAAPAPQEPEEPEPPKQQDRQRTGAATSLGPAPEQADKAKPQEPSKQRITPVARAIAEEHGIDPRSLTGSGPSGRIIKRDVLHAIEAGEETAAARAPSARPQEGTRSASGTAISMHAATGAGLEDRKIQLSNMRQTIAKRLVESKQQIPHYQVTMTFNMDPLLDLRKTLNKQLEPQNVKLSVNDFLVRACGLAMYEHPEMNASWEDSGIHIHGDINVAIAIALPRERGGGLVVGTVRNADQKALRLISTESKQLAQKARDRGLSPEEMSDSTFCISNLGMFGVEHFTAIINPPNSAILAVGAAHEKPVVRHGELTVGTEMQATLSLDHRVVDGAIAAQYMQTLKQMIENPASLLV